MKTAYIIGGIVLAILLIAGIWLYAWLQPPSKKPAYDGTRPTLQQDNGGNYVTHQEKVLVDVPVDVYDHYATTADLGDILKGSSNLPRVSKTEMIKGTWDEPGARRRVVLSDGHYAAEEVLERDKPELFRYMVWDYTNFAKLATNYAVGEFAVKNVDSKAEVTWTYSFHKRSPITAGFLEGFVRDTWAPYMHDTLRAIKEGAEKSAR